MPDLVRSSINSAGAKGKSIGGDEAGPAVSAAAFPFLDNGVVHREGSLWISASSQIPISPAASALNGRRSKRSY
tara:strand:- start:247 stop:468 length:222 start_codon:yes stop_codon:yes gene_type:complete